MSSNEFHLEETEKAMNQLQSQLKPSEEELKSELSQLDKIYNTAVKTQLEQLRKTEFIGVIDEEEGDDTQEGGASCSIRMTSQYEALEVTINPHHLLRILHEAQIETQTIEMDQLVQICSTLGELVRLTFNNAKEKTHAGSEKVFNQLIEKMQNSLFNKDS